MPAPTVVEKAALRDAQHRGDQRPWRPREIMEWEIKGGRAKILYSQREERLFIQIKQILMIILMLKRFSWDDKKVGWKQVGQGICIY